jgi:hypothetical protein
LTKLFELRPLQEHALGLLRGSIRSSLNLGRPVRTVIQAPTGYCKSGSTMGAVAGLWQRARPLDGQDIASRYLRSRGLAFAVPVPSLRVLDMAVPRLARALETSGDALDRMLPLRDEKPTATGDDRPPVKMSSAIVRPPADTRPAPESADDALPRISSDIAKSALTRPLRMPRRSRRLGWDQRPLRT